ncbi:MAG: hypothetical protein ACRD82_03805 [Blastocatellia bacterium]
MRRVANESEPEKSAPVKADIAVENTQTVEPEKNEGLKKEDELKAETAAAGTKPVKLPDVGLNPDQPITLTPLFDATTLFQQFENLKPAIPVTEEEIPPPPAKLHTRPRRVNLPGQPKPGNQ